LHAELDKNFRETEAWFNDSRAIREELNIDKSPDHTTLCRWEQQVDMRELRSLLRHKPQDAGQEQQQSMPVVSSEIRPAIIIGIVLASRFQAEDDDFGRYRVTGDQRRSFHDEAQSGTDTSACRSIGATPKTCKSSLADAMLCCSVE